MHIRIQHINVDAPSGVLTAVFIKCPLECAVYVMEQLVRIRGDYLCKISSKGIETACVSPCALEAGVKVLCEHKFPFFCTLAQFSRLFC